MRRLLWSVVVILDEATAYTNLENEAILQNSIVKLGAGNTCRSVFQKSAAALIFIECDSPFWHIIRIFIAQGQI